MNETAFDEKRAEVLSQIVEVQETRNINEIARMLASGNWIAFHATFDGHNGPLFSLGRISVKR